MTGPGAEAGGYAGPPPTTPPALPSYPPSYPPSPYGSAPYGHPRYGYPGYGYPGYGYPGYGYPWAPFEPPGSRRPGQVIAAAVLAFVQAAITAVATFYVFVLASFVDLTNGQSGGRVPADVRELATEGRVIAVVQLFGLVALVVGGIVALVRRGRPAWWVLVAALALQVVLAGYWLVRLSVLAGEVRSGSSPTTAFVILALFFAAMPATGLGLACTGPARRWFLPAGAREPAAA